MFAVLHALTLWHKEWIHGSLTVVSDNTTVVNALNKRSVRGPSLRPLRTILLIAAVLNIEIKARWIPSEENAIADAASRHDFKKLANLGFKAQVQELRNKPSAAIKMSDLRRQLNDFFNSHGHQPQTKTTRPSEELTSHSAQVATSSHTRQLSLRSPTGSPQISQHPSKQLQSKGTSMRSVHTTSKTAGLPQRSLMPGSIW